MLRIGHIRERDQPVLLLVAVARSLCRKFSSRMSTRGLPQRPRLSGDKHAAFDLVRFDRLEKRPKIAFAKTLVALAFDELEKDRANHRL